MAETPDQAWNEAFRALPQLKDASLSEKQAVERMQAIMRDELYNLDQVDNADEVTSRRTGKLAPMHRNPDEARRHFHGEITTCQTKQQ